MKGRTIVRLTFPIALLVLALGMAGCNPFSQGSNSSETTEQESASGTTQAQEPTTETTGAQGSASGGGGDQGANSASGEAGQGSASSEAEGQGSASGGGGDQGANSDSQGGGQQAASQNGGQGANSSQGDGEQASAENAGPQDALLRYYKAQNARNWEQAYQLLSSQSKQKVSLDQYAGVLSSQPPFTFKYSVVSTNVQGDTARIVIDSTVTSQGASQSRRGAKQLVREDGSWRLVLDETQIKSFNQAGQ